jgi:oligopeptide/dipeptide ABC transporter ATP-binding protein
MSSSPLLEIRGLNVVYGDTGAEVEAVVDVDLVVNAGEFLAVVGESGCGKSTLCFAIAQLLPGAGRIATGEVIFRGTNLVTLREAQLRQLRWRDYAVVMQSAMNALNPVLTIGAQLRDALTAHERISRRDARERAAEALRLVGVAPSHADSYPYQLSGGMRQRAMVAMAMMFTPDLLIMDEPTSALDVVAQRALMKEIKDLQERFGFAVIFVTHDMSLVSQFSDRVAVMYAGQVVELNATSKLFETLHPYTVGLLESFPSISNPKLRLEGIPGSPPDLRSPPSGCRFNPRCPSTMSRCLTVEPELLHVGGALVRCHLYDDDGGES